MVFNGETIRTHLPALQSGLALFDSPGGTQMPKAVADAIHSAATSPISNRSFASIPGRNAEEVVADFRAAMADFLGADQAGVIHGRSATSLIMDLARTLSRDWGAEDNVVVCDLDHDSNIAPWLIAAERAGVEVRWARFDPLTGELPVSQYEDLIDESTRLVAVTAASNLLGTLPDIASIAALAHAIDSLVVVDGVHYAAHVPVDVRLMGADFYVMSPYKIFGPHFGVMVADPDLLETLHPDKLRPSPNSVPERFEHGTLPYELLAGATAMVDYIASFAPNLQTRRESIMTAMATIYEYESGLKNEVEAVLKETLGVRVFSNAAARTSTLFFTVDGMTPGELEARLGTVGVVVQAGNFYAQEACKRLGLGPGGGVRVGLAPYNTAEDISRLCQGLETFLGVQ